MSKDSQKVKENEIRRKMNRRLECEIQRDMYKKFKWLHMRNEAFRLPTSTIRVSSFSLVYTKTEENS